MFRIRNFYIQDFVHVGYGGSGFQQDGTVRHELRLLRSVFRRVILISDITDDLLDDVFECDDSAGSPVFVNNDGEMIPGTFDLFEQFIDRFCLRNEDRSMNHAGETLFFRGDREKILGVNNAADLVDASAVYGNSAVSCGNNDFLGILDTGGERNGDHIHTRGHNLLNGHVGKVENSADHAFFPFFEFAVWFILHHIKDFVFDRAGKPEEAEKLLSAGKYRSAEPEGYARLGLLSRERDEAQWLYFAPCSTPGWSVGVIYPEKMLMKQLDQLEWQIGSLAVLGILMMVLTVAVINRRFSHPLVRLAGVAQSIGSGNFNTPVPAVRGLDEIGRLSSAFHSMQHELKRYVDELQENTAIRQKIESELEVARQIQRSILPAMLPPLPETPEFSLFALLRPARAVGGDLYDFFFLDEFHWCFIIGDVSGKGVPAALFMAVTQTLQRSESEKQHSPGALISRINNLLVRNNDSMMFVTYFLGVLDIRTGEVEYTNAGHNPPYILQGCGELKLLNTRHGPALGVVENQEYGSSRITLEEGDALVLYTDGVVEAMNPEFHEFGAESLRQVLARDRGLEPRIIGGDIVAAVDRFADGAEQADDITLLVLKYRKNGIAAG